MNNWFELYVLCTIISFIWLFLGTNLVGVLFDVNPSGKFPSFKQKVIVLILTGPIWCMISIAELIYHFIVKSGFTQKTKDWFKNL